MQSFMGFCSDEFVGRVRTSNRYPLSKVEYRIRSASDEERSVGWKGTETGSQDCLRELMMNRYRWGTRCKTILQWSMKGQGDPCKQGETAAADGCIPASGESGKREEKSEPDKQDYEVFADAYMKDEQGGFAVFEQIMNKYGIADPRKQRNYLSRALTVAAKRGTPEWLKQEQEENEKRSNEGIDIESTRMPRIQRIEKAADAIQFTDEVVNGRNKTFDIWGKDEYGNRTYLFKTPSGSYEMNMIGDHLPTLQFEDASGDYHVTGAGGAHEVFSKSSAAFVAYLKHENPESVQFSAEEKSRQKLYDRLAKTVAAIQPGYSVISVGDDPKHYLVVKRDKLPEYMKLAKEKFGKRGIEPEVLVKSLKSEVLEEWMVPTIGKSKLKERYGRD